MGRRAKYADSIEVQKDDDYSPPEHILHINGPRRFEPSSGTSDEHGPSLSQLVEHSSGDWSWKPERNKHFPQFGMPAFPGVPPSAAELYGRSSYRPA